MEIVAQHSLTMKTLIAMAVQVELFGGSIANVVRRFAISLVKNGKETLDIETLKVALERSN